MNTFYPFLYLLNYINKGPYYWYRMIIKKSVCDYFFLYILYSMWKLLTSFSKRFHYFTHFLSLSLSYLSSSPFLSSPSPPPPPLSLLCPFLSLLSPSLSFSSVSLPLSPPYPLFTRFCSFKCLLVSVHAVGHICL